MQLVHVTKINTSKIEWYINYIIVCAASYPWICQKNLIPRAFFDFPRKLPLSKLPTMQYTLKIKCDEINDCQSKVNHQNRDDIKDT